MKLKTELTTVDKIKQLVNVQIEAATMTIGDGEATLEAEVFEAGQPVFVVNGDDRIPLPVGEYLLDSGETLVVTEEGIIAEVRAAGEPEAEEEVAANASTTDGQSEQPLPKAIIESVVKETKFSKEDMEQIENLKAEIETLKTELAALKPVEEPTAETTVEVTEEPTEVTSGVELTKITPNPEAVEEPKMDFKFGQNRPKTYMDKVLSKISKIN